MHTATGIFFLAADVSKGLPFVSTIMTGSVGVKPMAASRMQHAVPVDTTRLFSRWHRMLLACARTTLRAAFA